MIKIKVMLLLFFLNLTIFPAETITWYKVPMPPFFINEGSYKDKGAHDLMLNFYKNKLNSYNHTIEVVSLKRLLELSKRFDDDSKFISMILLQNPERDEFLYFSRPYDFILSNHVIIKKDNLKLFEPFIDANGDFDLEGAIKSEKIRFGLGQERFYHKNINEITDKTKNIDFTFGINNQESIIKKLIAGRIDATIDYPESTEYILKEKNISLDFMAIPIKGIDPYNLLRISFPKNNWGLEMLGKFNSFIENYTKTKEFETLSLMWSPEKSKYMKKFREFKN